MHSESPQLRKLIERMADEHAAPLWSLYASQLTREPSAPDDAMHWRWERLNPLLRDALINVPMEHAERRVLLLSNPCFAPKTSTTTNLQGGIQILNPGENAPPHRHAAAAIRFVMTGSGAFTSVDGQRCRMEPGDLVLTPAWCWHEHEHLGQEPIAWFDGLDVPLVQSLSSAFLEFGPADSMPSALPAEIFDSGMLPTDQETRTRYQHYSPRFRYSAEWVDRALSAIAPAADGSRTLRYTNPVHGGPVMSTLDCYAMRLCANAATEPYRSTANAIAVVVKGAGRTNIGNLSFDWQKNDVFSIPHWNWVTHIATEPDTQLFVLTDIPVLESIGYLRVERNG